MGSRPVSYCLQNEPKLDGSDVSFSAQILGDLEVIVRSLLLVVSILSLFDMVLCASSYVHPEHRSWARATLGRFERLDANGLSVDPVEHNLALVRIDAAGLAFRYRGPEDVRLSAILDHIEQLSLKQDLPFGDYYFSLEDGCWADNLAPISGLNQPLLCASATRELVESGQVHLFPDAEALMGYDNLFLDLMEGNIDISERTNAVFWRGATTGVPEREGVDDIFQLPRSQVVSLYQNHRRFDVGFNRYVQAALDNPEFQRRFPLKPTVAPEEAQRYRYLLVMDGNAATYSRFAWALVSGSVPIKLRSYSDQVQWYYNQLPDDSILYADNINDILLEFNESSLNNDARERAYRSWVFAWRQLRLDGVKRYTARELWRYQTMVKGPSRVAGGRVNHRYLRESSPQDYPIVSLTTSPDRLRRLYTVLDRLDWRTVQMVVLNLPKKFARTGKKYSLSLARILESRYPKLRVQVVDNDLGPATKVLPVLEDYLQNPLTVVSLDDDHLYPPNIAVTLARVARKYEMVVSSSGQNIGFWGIDPEMFGPNAVPEFGDIQPRDVVEGFSGVAFRTGRMRQEILTEARWIFENSLQCRYSDDLVWSFLLDRHGVPRAKLENRDLSLAMVRPLEFGFRSDALHNGAGLVKASDIPDYNFTKYRQCAVFLQREFGMD